jgi:L-lactate dehydrogenase complex protein LldG
MGTERDRFLGNVRAAVAAGNRAGQVPSLPERAGVGYQGAGDDPVARFAAELLAAGGTCHVVADRSAAIATVLDILDKQAVKRVLVGVGPVIDTLDLPRLLRDRGVEVSDPGASRPTLFAADASVTGVDFLIAETGSIALRTAPDQPRSLSLLPPVYIAVADRGQLLPDLFDLFEKSGIEPGNLPACLSLITGPSKTGDIELRLVTGVHGPGVVHVVLISAASNT